MDLRDRREKSNAREDTLRNILGGSRGSKKGGRSFAGPIIIACAVIAMIVAADYWMNAGKIYRGVEVGTIALGGKTPEQAEEIITERTTGALKEIQLSGPEEFSRSAGEMGVDFNVSGTVDQAYAVGREGNLLDRLGERFEAAYGTVTIPPDVDYQPAKARVQVENLASRLDEKPRDATMSIIGSNVEVVGSEEGYKTDVAATMESVDSAVADMTGKAEIVGNVLKPRVDTRAAEEAGAKAREAMSGEMVFSAEGQKWTVTPAAIGAALDVTQKGGEYQVSMNRDRMRDNLATAYAALTVAPVEADYLVNGSDVTVQPGQIGMSVEDEKFLDAIENGIFEGERSYAVPVKKDKPELTTAEAERLKPTDLLSSYRTNYMTYDDSAGRVRNLEIASGAVNGTLLAPGEVFSFNALAEPLDYAETKVIVKGRVDTAEGGGLCQVSSTLYMAANLAGYDRIVVPLPIDDYTTSCVLTMDYVEGRNVSSIGPLGQMELDGRPLAEQLFRAYLDQILVHGFVHADPHPGNVLVTSDQRLALIDLGMVVHVRHDLQDSLIRLLASVSEGRADEVSEVLIQMGDEAPDFDADAYRRQIAVLVEGNQSVTVGQLDAGVVVGELARAAAASGLRPPVEMTMIGKALLNLDQVARILDPTFDPNAAIREHTAGILRQRLLASASPASILHAAMDAKEFAERLPGRVNKVMDALAEGQLTLNVQGIDEAELMRGIQKLANRVTTGIVVAALIIGAAMVMRIDTEAELFGYPTLAIVLFLVATVAGLWLAVTSIMNDLPQRRRRR